MIDVQQTKEGITHVKIEGSLGASEVEHGLPRIEQLIEGREDVPLKPRRGSSSPKTPAKRGRGSKE